MFRLMTGIVVLTAALMGVPAFAAEGDGDAEAGKELFETKCALCHNASLLPHQR